MHVVTARKFRDLDESSRSRTVCGHPLPVAQVIVLDKPAGEEQALLTRGQLSKGSSLVPDFERHKALGPARRESERA